MNKKIGLTAIAGAMALAACGQGPQPGVQQGNLTVNTAGLPANTAAPVTIVGEGQNRTLSVTNSQTVQLPRGSYTVTAGAVAGFDTPAAQTVTVGENSSVTVTYTAVTPGPTEPVAPRVPATVSFWNGGNAIVTNPSAPAQARNVVALRDEDGVFLPGRVENNIDKEAYLFAAQTEEDVCVTVRVVDNAGNPVNNSRVKIEATGLERGSVSVAAGCTARAAGVATPLNTDEVLTDSNGIARFTLFSTFEAGIAGEPVKVVVRASDQARQVSTPALEFKMFFLNMTHLYAQVNGGALQRTTQRTGQVFTVADVFRLNAEAGGNDATLNTLVYTKQPRQGPIAPQNLYGGAVVYTLSGADANLVRLVRPDDTVVAGNTYRDTAGTGVTLRPVGVTRDRLASGSVDATVTATYVFGTQYGQTAYEFPLKDYRLDRSLQSGFLTITKSVNNRVLTWQGPARTLAQSGPAAEPFTSQVRVVVRNPVAVNPNDPQARSAFNVSVRDLLPPELGYVAGSGLVNGANPGAVTYDPVLHAVTVNFNAAPELATVAPGQEIVLTFDVYARQKPGFAWTALEPNVTQGALPRNTQGAYADPYRVTNGAARNDVTVSYFPTSALNAADQIVEDYDPVGDESDIWVVRPLYEIRKTAPVDRVPLGGVAVFDIEIRQLNRVAIDANRRAVPAGNPIRITGVGYDTLSSRYGFEFGRDIPTVGDVVRFNPYGGGITVTDVFDNSLDFTNASPFGLGGVGGPAVSNPPTAAGKTITWSPIPTAGVQGGFMRDGQFAVARVFLNTNRVTRPEVIGEDGEVLERAELVFNCAYLGAPQLNQPQNLADSSYGANPPWLDAFRPNTGRVQGLYRTDLGAGFTAARPGNQLESCAGVSVFEREVGDVRLTFTNRGEFTDSTPNLIDANKRDGFSASTSLNFFYKFDSQNVGARDATNVRVTFARDNNSVLWVPGGQYIAYTSLDGSTWTQQAVGAVAGNTVSFTNITVPGRGFVRFVLEGDPNFEGITNVDGTLVYEDVAPIGTVTLTTQEVTTVIP